MVMYCINCSQQSVLFESSPLSLQRTHFEEKAQFECHSTVQRLASAPIRFNLHEVQLRKCTAYYVPIPSENLPWTQACCGQLSFHSGIHTGCSEKGFLPFAENSAEEFNQPSYCVNVLGLVHSCIQYA